MKVAAAAAGESPRDHASDFPVSADAERHKRFGPSFLHRCLPFWVATFIERLIVVVVPLLVIVVHLINFLPQLVRWRVRSRIFRSYGELAGAIKYSLVRWTALTRYRDDGRIEIDNNRAERSIRLLVLGRRNYMFAGSDVGGERAANIYSLIGTALLDAMDPYLYLRHVLERIAEHRINRIDELLPWSVAATLSDERRQAA